MTGITRPRRQTDWGRHYRERREPGLGNCRYKGAGGTRGLRLVVRVVVDLFWVASGLNAKCLAKVVVRSLLASRLAVDDLTVRRRSSFCTDVKKGPESVDVRATALDRGLTVR